MLTDEQAVRFWKKVTIPTNIVTDCWLWTASKQRDGYGMFGINYKLKLAHRVSYEEINGPIAVGMFLDHTCHTRHCVNPHHLREVTKRQNCQNRKGKNTGTYSSTYPGVSWYKRDKKWIAHIWNGKLKNLGSFPTEQEASDAYQAALAKIP